jgi:peptidoglycan/xylan/chitin deacetylase (PgdA/CDA1 family)
MIVAAAKKAIRRGLGLVAPAVWSLRPKPSLVILTYHRVLPKDHPDRQFEQPGMYVSPETLEMHLRVVKKHFEIVDLGDWVRRSKDGEPLPDRACAITFDDGWKDNYDYGFPVLVRQQVPATIFLVSDFIGSNYEFWPNRLARLLRNVSPSNLGLLPEALLRVIRGSGLPEDGSHGAATVEQIDMAIAACKSLPDSSVLAMLDLIEDRLPSALRALERDLLDLIEIKEMKDSGLVKFGSHTRRHTRLLAGIDAEVLDSEVRRSREHLEASLGCAVELLCYPNGDYSPAALNVAKETYLAAVTTECRWAYCATDRHRMPRVAVHEDIVSDEKAFLCRLGVMV